MKKGIKVVTLDTETRGLEGEIFRAGMYDGEDYYDSENIDHLLRLLKNWSLYDHVHVYIHNLNFDLRKFAEKLVKPNNLYFKDMLFINNNVVTFPVNGIIFHDSFRILSSSLEKLCKAYGLEETEGKVKLDDYMKEQGYKNKEDFFKRVPADDPVLTYYLEMDCVSLYTVLERTREAAHMEWKEFVKCPTVASMAMRVYRTQFADDFKRATCTAWDTLEGKRAEQLIRKAYRGGRVEVFIPRMMGGFHYDVNSLYPYVMKVNDFPYGEFDEREGDQAQFVWSKRQKYGNNYCMGFVEASVHIPPLWIPPLPVNRDDKLIFPVGNVRDIWTMEELENAMRYGVEVIAVHRTLTFSRKAPLFHNFVMTYEDLKKNATGAKREFAKTMQNSLYGKFGTGRVKEGWFGKWQEDELRESGIDFKRVKNHVLNVEFLIAKKEISAKYIQPQLAAYVTSFARILLYNSIMAQVSKGDLVAYCDTDSMVCSSELPEDMVHDKDYGKWKKEYELEKALFLQPKLYYERTTEDIVLEDGTTVKKEIIKGKGIPKAILESFTEETYENILSAKQSGQEEFKLYDGLMQLPKFGALMKNDLPMETIVHIKKSLNLLAKEKRQMDYDNNSSSAHTIMDF